MNTNRVLLMLTFVVCVFVLPLMAATETVGGYTWTYQINGDTAEIYNDGYIAVSPKLNESVTIPDVLGG